LGSALLVVLIFVVVASVGVNLNGFRKTFVVYSPTLGWDTGRSLWWQTFIHNPYHAKLYSRSEAVARIHSLKRHVTYREAELRAVDCSGGTNHDELLTFPSARARKARWTVEEYA